MRVAPSCALAGLLLCAAAAAFGADGGTLDGTKRELQQLQSDQKNKTGQTGDKVKLDTPTLDLAPEAGSAEAWLANKLRKERKLKEQGRDKPEANSNWLVEGVEKLEKEENAAKGTNNAAAKPATTTETAPHAIDSSDSQYLLKLFDEQKKPADSKATTAKSSVTATPDPLAPFMQNWLGSSPVRGQFFDQFAGKKPDGGGVGEGTPVVGPNYRSSAVSTTTPVLAAEPVTAEKTNPYLAELNTPILTREVTTEASQLQSLNSPTAAPEAARSTGPAPLPADTTSDSRERAKAPLPGLTDDKKYFPQLKRF